MFYGIAFRSWQQIWEISQLYITIAMEFSPCQTLLFTALTIIFNVLNFFYYVQYCE